MTDDLRTRIMAALTKEDQLRVCKLSDADIRFMADAVIEALDAHGWLIDPESADREWQNEKARWLKGEDDE